MRSVESLERGLKVLNLLSEIEADVARRRHGLSVQQVATELGIHKSTASRLMQTLVAGYATRQRGDGRRGFGLGPAVHLHVGLTADQRRLRDVAQPFLASLVSRTHECAHVAVASGASALVIDDLETGHPLRLVAQKGRRESLHCTSAGKCLLAFGLAGVRARRRCPSGCLRGRRER
jgi:DNA-binding IclR family transcriptional regulator